MAPLTPNWIQPSHSQILVVKSNPNAFTSLSKSLVNLPAGAVFAKLTFPPLAYAEKAYSTVQISRDLHVELNSDLLYTNHSCDPNLVFDMQKMEVRVVDNKELRIGDETTFFYPSTEWEMAQPFDCTCGSKSCKGTISGAKDMGWERIGRSLWVNEFIEELLDELEAERSKEANGYANGIRT